MDTTLTTNCSHTFDYWVEISFKCGPRLAEFLPLASIAFEFRGASKLTPEATHVISVSKLLVQMAMVFVQMFLLATLLLL